MEIVFEISKNCVFYIKNRRQRCETAWDIRAILLAWWHHHESGPMAEHWYDETICLGRDAASVAWVAHGLHPGPSAVCHRAGRDRTTHDTEWLWLHHVSLCHCVSAVWRHDITVCRQTAQFMTWNQLLIQSRIPQFTMKAPLGAFWKFSLWFCPVVFSIQSWQQYLYGNNNHFISNWIWPYHKNECH